MGSKNKNEMACSPYGVVVQSREQKFQWTEYAGIDGGTYFPLAFLEVENTVARIMLTERLSHISPTILYIVPIQQ